MEHPMITRIRNSEHRVSVEWADKDSVRKYRMACTCGDSCRWMKDTARVAALVKLHQDQVARYAR